MDPPLSDCDVKVLASLPITVPVPLASGLSVKSVGSSTPEVGVVVGYLGQRVLGQYELVLLDEAEEDRPPRLLFVLPNLGSAVQAFGA